MVASEEAHVSFQHSALGSKRSARLGLIRSRRSCSSQAITAGIGSGLAKTVFTFRFPNSALARRGKTSLIIVLCYCLTS